MTQWLDWPDFVLGQQRALLEGSQYLEGLREKRRALRQARAPDYQELKRLERLIDICEDDLRAQSQAFEELVKGRGAPEIPSIKSTGV